MSATRLVGLDRDDLLVLGDEPELVAIADAFQATQQGLAAGVARRRSRRSRRLVVAAAVLFVLAGLASVALARDLDLFAGTPAPADVRQRFVTWNDTRGWHPSPPVVPPGHEAAAQAQLAKYGKVDPSRAHGVVEVELAPGVTYQLWAAPLEDGSGECPILQHVDAQGVARGGSWSPAWCVTSDTAAEPRFWGSHWTHDTNGRTVRPGAAPGAAAVELRFAVGTSVRGPVVEGFFLVPAANPLVGGSGPQRGKRPEQDPAGTVVSITSYDGEGHVLAVNDEPQPAMHLWNVVAAYLGIPADEVRRAQLAKTTLAELATAKGKTPNGLAEAIAADREAAAAPRVADGLITAEEARASAEHVASVLVLGRPPDCGTLGDC